MGKAVVELPDPLNPSLNPKLNAASDARADDLISQLAGEQIDQLLHEAPPKTEGPRAIPVAPPPPVVAQVETRNERAALSEVLDYAVEPRDDLPIALQPLKWLNAPFAGMSPQARQTLGRLAILLLVNAAAVLSYVLVFGRR